jgi:hypothetical protein
MPKNPSDEAEGEEERLAKAEIAANKIGPREVLTGEAAKDRQSFAFDPETVHLLGEVYDAAWREFKAACPGRMSKAARRAASATLTRHLMAAAHAGERDPGKLKRTALAALDSK